MKAFKKAVFVILAIVVASGGCIAQKDTIRYDYVRPQKVRSVTTSYSNYLSLGFGLGGYYPYAGPMYSASPSVSLLYERELFKQIGPGNISLGALTSYKNIESGYTDYATGYDYVQHWNYYILGLRATYHFNAIPGTGIEPYAGAMIGYYITTFHVSSNDPYYTEPSDPGYYLTPNTYPNFFAPSVFAGIRTRFDNRGSVWLEAGYGYTTVAFGLSFGL